MADTWGAAQLPPLAPTDGPAPNAGSAAGPGNSAVTDPGLDVFLAFLKAVINAELTAAWEKRLPNSVPVSFTYTWNPEDSNTGFSDNKVGALYGYRKAGQVPYDYAADLRAAEDTWTVLWVPLQPTAPRARFEERQAFANGLGKVVDDAIWKGRHPAYQKALDPNTKSLDVAVLPAAILLSKVTYASPQSYTGAGLDGSIGPATIDPLRAITVALGGSPGAFSIGSTITVSGTNPLGISQAETFVILTGADSFTTGRGYSAITAVSIDAQVNGTGTVTVGTNAYDGRGTLLMPQLGANLITPIKPAAWRYLTIQQVKGPPLKYPAVEFSYRVREVRLRDTSTLDATSLEYWLTDADGNVIDNSIPQ